MTSAVKNYKVTIFGDQYTLASDETGDTLMHAASMVDDLMKEISQQAKVTDPKKIAVLVALQMACKALDLEAKHMAHNEKLIDRINQELISL